MERKFRYISLFVLICSVLLYSSVISKSSVGSFNAVHEIHSDYDNGKISLDDFTLLIIKAVKQPEKLPSQYQASSLSLSVDHLSCVTPELIFIKNNWNNISASVQASFLTAFTPSESEFTYDSPGGFFKLHYDLTGIDAVSPIDNDVNGVPDYIDRCAAYCDSSLTKHQVLGYMDPPDDYNAGGDDLYDIYFEEMGSYGYTVPSTPGPEAWNDYISYISLHRDFIGFPPNDDPEGNPEGAAKATAAHEFHHAVQMAYDVGEDLWVIESDATYMEDIVFNQVNDNYNYFSPFFNDPENSILENSSHAYASFLWEMFLSEKFDTSLLVAIWEGARYSSFIDAIDDTLQGRYGWTIDSAFAEFAQWNYLTGIRDDGLHYSEGSDYPLISINRSHNSYPVTLSNPFSYPEGYAAGYIRFIPPAFGTLHLTFNGEDNRQWRAWVIKSITQNSHEFEMMPLDPVSFSGSLEILNFQDYYSVTLVAVNISEFETSGNYSYSAQISIPYAISSSLLTDDTLIYSGDTKIFEIHVENVSVVNDIISLVYWDDAGWLLLDSVSKALNSTSDTILTIDINPPQGTPLNLTSNLNFVIKSWGDENLSDTINTKVTTILQHGDSNFSGRIDISDLTYFVAFLFNEGPYPIPVDIAGDYNCSSDLTVSDLTKLVEYLFQNGSIPPCNPY